MIGSHPRLLVIWALLPLTIFVSSPSLATSPPQAMWRQFGMALDLCTSKTGFDPYKVPDDVGAYEIAAGEPEWRSCVYDAIEIVLVPNSRIPQVYDELIEQDREFTERILRKEATRQDRKNANVSALARIIPAEQLLYEKELEDRKQRLEELQWEQEQQRMQDHIDDLERTVNDLSNSFRN